MQPFTNKGWLKTLAAELPQVNVTEDHHYLRLTHQQGLTISAHSHLQRLVFGVINLQALNTSLICPIKPPSPITVDPHRAITRIAAELQRRLITPALPWYIQALQWQQENAAQFAAQQATRAAFVAAGGRPHPDYSQLVSGHHWRAQITSADTVTLNLESLPADKALAIVQMLTA
jgi:hypothetical protein